MRREEAEVRICPVLWIRSSRNCCLHGIGGLRPDRYAAFYFCLGPWVLDPSCFQIDSRLWDARNIGITEATIDAKQNHRLHDNVCVRQYVLNFIRFENIHTDVVPRFSESLG